MSLANWFSSHAKPLSSRSLSSGNRIQINSSQTNVFIVANLKANGGNQLAADHERIVNDNTLTVRVILYQSPTTLRAESARFEILN